MVRADYRTSEKQLLDRRGEILHELRVDATRRRLGWTAIADISPVTLEAVVRAEDRRFFAHRGVDWRAGAGALWNALRGGRRRGASTITMQLAAELDRGLRARSKGRGLRQKWAQMRAAFALESGLGQASDPGDLPQSRQFPDHFGAQLHPRPASLVCGVTVLTPRSKRGWVSARFRAPDGTLEPCNSYNTPAGFTGSVRTSLS